MSNDNFTFANVNTGFQNTEEEDTTKPLTFDMVNVVSDSINQNQQANFNDLNFSDVNITPEEYKPVELLNLNSITSDQIKEDNNRLFYEQENIKKDPPLAKRIAVKFLEGVSPIPLDYSSAYEEPETALDSALGTIAYGTGFATSFLGAGFLTGGLKIVGTGAKTIKSLSKASKSFNRLSNINKQVKIAKKTKNVDQVKKLTQKAQKIEALIDNDLAKAGVVGTNTLLGRQKFYKKFVSRLGSNDYEVGKFMSKIGVLEKPSSKLGIQAANALNLGVTNLAGSLLMTQKTIPLRNEEGEYNIAKRIYKPALDSMFYTAAGLPRVLSVGGIDKMILNSAKGKALESIFVYSTGIGSSVAGFGIRGEGETTLEDNLIDGAIFTMVHYMGVGADNIQVKEAVKNGIRAVTDDKKVIKKVLDSTSDDVMNEVRLLMDTSRPEYLTQRFVNKQNSNKLIQLKGIKQNRKGDKHTLSYQVIKSNDGTTGDTFTYQGLSRKDALSKFYKDYKNVLINPKQLNKDYLKKNSYNLKAGNQLKKDNPEIYKEHQKLSDKILKTEEKLGITLQEGSKLRRGGFTKSYGNMDRMSIEELNTYSNMLTTKKHATSIKRATANNYVPFELPDGFLSNNKTSLGIKKYTGSFQNVLSGLGNAGSWLSKHLTDYADTKNIIRGANVTLKSRIKKDFNLNEKQYKSLMAVENKDEKVSKLIDFNNIKDIEDKDLLKKRLRDYFDEHFVELAKYNGKIQVGKNKYEKLLNVIDVKTGKSFDVNEESFINGDVLKVLKGKKKTLKDKDGKTVTVDLQKTKDSSYYVDNYVPHYLSENALKIFDKDPEGFVKRLRASVMQKNPFKKSLFKNKADYEAEIDTIVNNFKRFSDSKKPLGILNTRKVDIPPYMVIEKGTKNIIQLGETVNIGQIKKGQVIKDIDNQDKIVGDIIEIYEKDFDKIMDRYSNQIANSISLFRNFDERGISLGGELATKINKIEDRYGKDVRDYVENGFRLALSGQKKEDIGFFGDIGRRTSKFLANIYLSGPSASIKNFGAGQTQNLASFKTGEFFKGWGKFLLNRNSYDELTKNVGAITTNVDELALGFKGKFSPLSIISKPFAAVERLNRSASVAITDVSLRDSFQSILKNKKSTYFNNPTQANQALKRVMKMEDDDIKYMLDKLKSSRNKGEEAFDILVESDSKFKDIYKRALYKSQASTQGATQLPYIPTWMADENKKWATLFYRTAYRVTENTYDNVIVPFVADGNPFPLLKYAAGSALTGYATYELYYNTALGRDLLGSNFKETPIKLFDYAVRGEALGIYSNLFDEYGSALTSFIPATVEFATESANFFKSLPSLRDKTLIANGIVDYSKNVSLINQADAFYKRINNEVNSKFQRNRDNVNNFFKNYPQFGSKRSRNELSEFFKKGELYEKQMHYKLLAESLKNATTPQKIKIFENNFLKTRAFLEHQDEIDLRKRKENSYKLSIRKKAHKNIKQSMMYQLRPYPKAWDSRKYGIRTSNFYLKNLTPEDRKNAKEVMSIHNDRMRILAKVMGNNYRKYQSE